MEVFFQQPQNLENARITYKKFAENWIEKVMCYADSEHMVYCITNMINDMC